MKKILLVEDSATIQKALKAVLERKGYAVDVVSNGEEALETVEQSKPDVVILDTVLPGIDGYEVCRRMKSQMGAAAPKIIIVTGNIEAVDASKARAAGADEYTAKTSDFALLLNTVSDLV